MSWITRFKIKERYSSSIWFIPLCWAVFFGVLGALSWRFDMATGWRVLDFSSSGAQALMAAIVGSMVTFIGFVFSTLLIVVQFAGSQMTPRVLKTTLTDFTSKITLALFLSTFVFATTTLARITSDFVPQVSLLISCVLVAASLVMFLILINHVSHSLRPVIVADRVGRTGIRTIDQMYPTAFSENPAALDGEDLDTRETPTQTVAHAGHGSVVMAVDVKGLVKLGRIRDALIVLAPAVGDFIPSGSPLFYVFGGSRQIPAARLRKSIALGPERTIQQDPAFALRILVDIAVRALSHGINDPTTAVVAIDQIHAFLQRLGGRRLDSGQYLDAGGTLRFEMQTPTWDDLVSLGLDEIRQFGGTSIQILRRLRALLEDLLAVLPAARHPPLQDQLDMLDRAVPRGFREEADQRRAGIGDTQGLGSSRETGHRRAKSPQ